MKNKMLSFFLLLVPAALAAQEPNRPPKATYTPGRWYAEVNYGMPPFHYVGSYRNVMGYGGYRLGQHFFAQLGGLYQRIGYDDDLTYLEPPYSTDGTWTVHTSESLFGIPLRLRVSLLGPERRFNAYLLTGLTAAWQSLAVQYVRVAAGAAVEQGSRRVRSQELYYEMGLGVQGRIWNRFFLTSEFIPFARRLSGPRNGISPSLPYNLGIRYEFKQ